METIFINTENSKISEPHKSILNLLQRLDLRNSNKYFKIFLFITLGKILNNNTKTINSK